jgi:lipopolysaccharide transport system permease protein
MLGYIGARFRDVPHALGLALQALWFISPIYFEPKIFRSGGLDAMVDMNPVYHLLQIVRAPLLDEQWPTLENYGYCLSLVVILTIMALFTGLTAEKRVIYYL